MADNNTFQATGLNQEIGKEYDLIQGKTAEIKLSFMGHGSVMLESKGRLIHVDPWEQVGGYVKEMPSADVILVTHEHSDHFDSSLVKRLKSDKTQIICNKAVEAQISDKKNLNIMANGEKLSLKTTCKDGTTEEVTIEAVAAYNIEHLRDGKNPFHPKANGNGYIVGLDGVSIYFAGDTENIPEMKDLKSKNIDVAFLPMNLPYTMDVKMFVDATNMICPKAVYPYHTVGYSFQQVKDVAPLIKNCQIRVRKFD